MEAERWIIGDEGECVRCANVLEQRVVVEDGVEYVTAERCPRGCYTIIFCEQCGSPSSNPKGNVCRHCWSLEVAD